MIHETIGEYLAEHDPVLALWHHLEEMVVRNGSGTPVLEGLTLPASTIYLVGGFEGAIVKGGFREFLFKPSGDLSAATLQALREVGAHVSVELLEKAMTVFADGQLPTSADEWKSRSEQFDRESPHFFDPFDELFNQHVDAQSPHRVENLNTLLLDYLKEHAAVRLTY